MSVLTYHWVITKDHTAGENEPSPSNLNAVGMIGPSGATLTAEEIQGHPEAIKFRMLDDDENLYYEGFSVDGNDGTGLEPLDDFGTPNAGAVTIQHQGKNGQWETI